MSAAPGAWRSPLTAALVAGAEAPVSDARFAAERICYAQRIPAEGGRIGVFTTAVARPGEARQLLPAGFSARSRVHEYGGGAWALDDAGLLVFVNGADQRLYRLDTARTGADPEPLTPASGAAVRYGGLAYSGGRLLGIREAHLPGGIERAIVAIDPRAPAVAAHTSAEPAQACAAPAVAELARGPHFLAQPQLSPDGALLAFIGWDHPDMPWDETRLYLCEPGGEPCAVFGQPGESVLQPQWLSTARLAVSADRTGTWTLYRLSAPDFLARAQGRPGAMRPEAEPLLADQGEIGGPLWSLDARWYLPARGGSRILAQARSGTSRLLWADASPAAREDGDVRELPCELSAFALEDVSGDTALLLGGGPDRITGLYAYDIPSGRLFAIALAAELPVPAAYLPRPAVREFDGVHAIVYPPHSPDAEAAGPAPYLAVIHGGPTAQATPRVSLEHAYFTSRGIGVVEVDYGGSTGYGRAYRERLRGRWGEVDVADAVTVMTALVAEGAADPARLGIRGGSAGGYTVLRALTDTTVFAAGASYYGVADLTTLAASTHDFESRYVEGLAGGPEAYAGASPLGRLDTVRAPIAIFQGDVDPVVPRSQAEQLAAGLDERGVPYAALFFPGESHGFTQPANIAAALEAELSFYGRVMGFETPDVPPVVLRGRGR
ncbi:prolyl oligopeptidase family serine peptidase [Brevibacterium sp. 5221]|uniref:Prolyl oligopeptidase family serine peptidase n=1 Tax=Brevibacterium rongguiense TaxID=2695267 RepID=A0A6N9H720_9MICO|nr:MULTISPECIES: prolyl oligopeptidase family serine peptidase [Brevibacterium]MYM19897.1 prolyl oligopeptidase family serine peptidase [Brevibacterium rongguiense]WAL41424.1 prolyl oligopeptidase family serine peptidase [Brevibacterium sp. BRM-1]